MSVRIDTRGADSTKEQASADPADAKEKMAALQTQIQAQMSKVKQLLAAKKTTPAAPTQVRTRKRKRIASGCWRRADKVLAAYEAHCKTEWGTRWPSLRAALLRPVRHVARINRFADNEQALAVLPESVTRVAEFGDRVDAFVCSQQYPMPQRHLVPAAGGAVGNVEPFYLMCGASVCAALALQTEPGHAVLDLCAAPGGKSLILAEQLVGRSDGSLSLNDSSEARRIQMEKNTGLFIPVEKQHNISTTAHDGTKFVSDRLFDRVLVDAPCSGDRHLIQKLSEAGTGQSPVMWSVEQANTNSQRQQRLLHAALDNTRPGGRVVYSTCAISAIENDHTVQKVLEKRSPGSVGLFSLADEAIASLGENTECGVLILPDTCKHGWGPIYFSIILVHDQICNP